jgi:hypothetical protein
MEVGRPFEAIITEQTILFEKMRKMGLIFLSVVGCCMAQSKTTSPTLKPILLSTDGSSRATAYIDSNKIAETENFVFVTYLDFENGEYLIKVKRFDKEEGKWSKPTAIDKVEDNHGGGSIVVDSKGYLHIAYGPHIGPFYYRSSTEKEQIDSWEERISVGSNMTYPSLVISKEDKLYLLGRHSISRGPWGLYLFTKEKGKDWSNGQELVRSNYIFWKDFYTADNPKNLTIKNGYTRWNKSIALANDGTIHISFKNYEMLPRNYKLEFTDKRNGGSYFVSHIYSKDDGETWYSGNKNIPTPAYPKDLEIISGGLDIKRVKANHGISNIVLKNGIDPYFVFSKEEMFNSGLFLAYMASGQWHTTQITKDADLNAVYYCPASITFNDKGELWVAATSIEKEKYNRNELWGTEQKHSFVTVFKISQDHNIDTVLVPKVPRPNWLPSISHFTGPKPKLLLTQGESTSDKTKVYYLEME